MTFGEYTVSSFDIIKEKFPLETVCVDFRKFNFQGYYCGVVRQGFQGEIIFTNSKGFGVKLDTHKGLVVGKTYILEGMIVERGGRFIFSPTFHIAHVVE